MAKQELDQRTFVKKVDGKTVERTVTNAQSEVDARFEGYLPKDEAPKSSTGNSSGSRSSSGNSSN